MWYRPRWLILSALLLMLVVGGTLKANAQARSAVPPVVFFDIKVSLEWQPGSDDDLRADLAWQGCTVPAIRGAYLEDLQLGLRQAAMYIFNYSGGQMALRNIEIYTNSEHWDDADIRILADNDFRPTAFIGGIVGSKTSFTSPLTGARRVFYPEGMLFGRQWSGEGARCGLWSAAEGWRTIGHEWGHYALFLWDGYLSQKSAKAQYCSSANLWLPSVAPDDPTIANADSLMAYQYRADHLWGPSGDPSLVPTSCKDTPQTNFYGFSEWEAAALFYPVQPPTVAVDPKEALQYLAFNIVTPQTLAHSSAKAVVKSDGEPVIAQSFLIEPGSGGRPKRVFGQGLMVTGEKELFVGVNEANNARAAVLIENWMVKKRLFYPEDTSHVTPLRTGIVNDAEPKPSGWQPGLRLVPLVMGNALASRVAGFRIFFTDCAAQTKRVAITYCPAGGLCHDPIIVTTLGGQGMATLWLPPTEDAAAHGYFHLRDMDYREESTTWYQLGGGVGPATAEIHAPLVDGPVDISVANQSAPLNSDSNVLYTPMDMCSADGSQPPPLPLIGPPLRIEPVVANSDGGTPWGRRESPLIVRLSYSQDLLDRLGIDERSLVVLYLDKPQGVWTRLQPFGGSRDLDWISVEQRDFSGRGGIYALAYRR